MKRSGLRQGVIGCARTFVGAAVLSILLVPLPALTQPRPQAPINFMPTIEEPAPGVDPLEPTRGACPVQRSLDLTRDHRLVFLPAASPRKPARPVVIALCDN